MANFGRYTLLRRVAMGGMAEIWKAKVMGPAGFQKTVAIKKILPHLVEDSAFIEMFIEEAKLVADLVHPNIVQVFDFGQQGNQEYFIAMEYVPGANLGRIQKRVLERGGKIPPGVSLYAIAEASKGLAYAHARTDGSGSALNIVHRDVSPQNILVSFGGDVKVGDFGIAKAASASSRTEEGHVRGKLSYMSPEQANAKPMDGRSDLFSLGLILYELLTGRKLFGANTTAEIYSRVAGYSSLNSEDVEAIPPTFRTVTLKSLQPDPKMRFQTGTEMERALTAILGTEGLVRARQALSSMTQSLFDEERKFEMTPTPGAEQYAAPGEGGGESPLVVGGVQEPGVTVATPTTPAKISGLTLASSKIDIRGKKGADPITPLPKKQEARSSSLLWVFIVMTVLSVGAAYFLGVKLAQGPQATPQPSATATAVAANSVPATSTASSGATPTATRTRVVATASPVTTINAPTPTPTRVVTAGRNGSISVTSRPWVQVWIDGKMVQQETPLPSTRLSAGPHQVRFVNKGMNFDETRTVQVAADREVTVTINVTKGTISIR